MGESVQCSMRLRRNLAPEDSLCRVVTTSMAQPRDTSCTKRIYGRHARGTSTAKLSELQGKVVPRLFAHVQLVFGQEAAVSVPAELLERQETAQNFQVKGLLMQQIDGYKSGIFPHRRSLRLARRNGGTSSRLLWMLRMRSIAKVFPRLYAGLQPVQCGGAADRPEAFCRRP